MKGLAFVTWAHLRSADGLFQNAVSKNAMQFKGNAQHDAQEFLLWLLDRVHEDINTVNSRPPIKVMLAPTV